MTEERKNFVSKTVIAIAVLILSPLLFFLILNSINGNGTPKDYLQIRQFRIIGVGLDFFSNENNGYPPSDGLDPVGKPYCGAMKLSEALIGKDLLGFHPDSVFRADGMDSRGKNTIYPLRPTNENIKARKELFLTLDHANPYRLLDIYGSGNAGPFNEIHFVLCDMYIREMETGRRTGMPILYYKANTSNTKHDVNNPDNPNNIYNYKDNHALLSLGIPWKPKKQHPLFINPKNFYEMTKDRSVRTQSKPVRADSFILISAGFDGLYGTKDDICNFEWKYRE